METEDAAQPANPTTEIARDGNVILVIGPEKKRIRVCSMVLSNASRYFRAMFGPHFSEGQGLTSNPAGPKEIEMPEDDADALELVCCIIHVCNDLVPDALAPQILLKFLATADKFECLIAMRFIGRIWLAPERHHKCRKMEDTIALMMSACALEHPEGFSKATMQFIKLWDGKFMKLPTGGIHLSDDFLWHTIYALAERRIQLYLKLLEHQPEVVKDVWKHHDAGCPPNNFHAARKYVREGRISLKDVAEKSIWKIQMRMLSLEQEFERGEKCCSGMEQYLRSFIEDINEGYFKQTSCAVGLCLDCIRSRSTGNKLPRRIKHD